MDKLPWYKDGLQFKCTGCGKCCTGPSGFVWVDNDEMMAMAEELGISLDLFKRRYTRMRDNRYSLTERKTKEGEYDCVFLKDKKCEIYEVRPSQCRVFPWWKENLNSEESWKLAAISCEGINDQAPLIPYAQIISEMPPEEKM